MSTTEREGYDPHSHMFDEQAMLSRQIASEAGVTDGDFHYLWNEVLRSWFPFLSAGWKVRQQRVTDISIPAFEVYVRCDSSGKWLQDVTQLRTDGVCCFDEKLVILGVVKSALQWSDEGRESVLKELKMIMQEKLLTTGVPVVWGIAAIGWQWTAAKQESTGAVEELVSWKSDVLGLESWRAMKEWPIALKSLFKLDLRCRSICSSRSA